MTQEEKSILLKDLCARLYYTYNSKGIIDYKYSIKGIISYIGEDMIFTVIGIYDDILYLYASEACQIEDFKPYLRPMSSMTEEEDKEYTNIDNRAYSCPKDYAHIPASERIDWLNAHHFDYRGLIEKNLALKAPNGMYK